MRRSRALFIFLSVFFVALSAAAFADTPMVTSDQIAQVNAVLQADKPQGWLRMEESAQPFGTIVSEDQALVGAGTDQLTQEMGAALTTSDGHGGTWYYYRVGVKNFNYTGARAAYTWFDVGSDGKVASVNVTAG